MTILVRRNLLIYVLCHCVNPVKYMCVRSIFLSLDIFDFHFIFFLFFFTMFDFCKVIYATTLM